MAVPPKPKTTTDDPLVAFLYLLTRDELPFGRVTNIISEVERAFSLRHERPSMPVFSNAGLAKLCEELAERIRTARGDAPLSTYVTEVSVTVTDRKGGGGNVQECRRGHEHGITLCGLIGALHDLASQTGDHLYIENIETSSARPE